MSSECYELHPGLLQDTWVKNVISSHLFHFFSLLFFTSILFQNIFFHFYSLNQWPSKIKVNPNTEMFLLFSFNFLRPWWFHMNISSYIPSSIYWSFSINLVVNLAKMKKELWIDIAACMHGFYNGEQMILDLCLYLPKSLFSVTVEKWLEEICQCQKILPLLYQPGAWNVSNYLDLLIN